MNHNQRLEFDQIIQKLADYALSAQAKQNLRNLTPYLDEKECRRAAEETTQAKKIIESQGNPPLPMMVDLEEPLAVTDAGGMLQPEQIETVARFCAGCARLKSYLSHAEQLDVPLANYHYSIDALADLEQELTRSIRSGLLVDDATPELASLRRKITQTQQQITLRLESMLRGNKQWFSEQFVTTRMGRLVLPVKREYRQQVPGTVVETSKTGGTVFIEPQSAQRLQQELCQLTASEENEQIQIFYTLTAYIADQLATIRRNKRYLETLDFIFAKARLSLAMGAEPVVLTTGRNLTIIQGRHPLLDPNSCVPLDCSLDSEQRGIVITGPNTGGKTVALKTIGLLSLMAQAGLHVPASPQSTFCMFSNVLCDIGDGQSIPENLSTFSAHIRSIVEILAEVTSESLVLLDELGSGTDPAEGMGLAVAILQELEQRNCLFAATTHYPQVKELAGQSSHMVNARMEFDRENIRPLYRLQIGKAGESCAFYIAEKLGFPPQLLASAHRATYGTLPDFPAAPEAPQKTRTSGPRIRKEQKKAPQTNQPEYRRGDSVMVLPDKEIGIVYQTADHYGMVGVQIKKKKQLVNQKRLRLVANAAELYPEDYDFSIIFDRVTDRKARKQMTKHHDPNNVIVVDPEK